MSPQNFPHQTTIMLALEILRAAFPGCMVRPQLPLDVSPTSSPEPDLAVVPGDPRSLTATPTTALLVVEVADTSLSDDRGEKASLYTAAGVPEYWIVNLIDRSLEIYRVPRLDAAQPSGWAYTDVTVLTTTQSVNPLAAPTVSVSVADLMP
jgi:Uma2 family endonuclease